MLTATLEKPFAKEDVLQFHELGYAGPFTACTPDEMADLRSYIDCVLLKTPPRPGVGPMACRHLTDRRLWEFIHNPQIVQRAAAILGPDVLCWSTNFWIKETGGKEIPWHQDFQYWPIEPPVNLTAWVAIDPVTVENSCVRVIPGSHKKIIPEMPTTKEQIFEKCADRSMIDDTRAVNMELRPGEFFLFNERLLHQSHRNDSTRRRMGMTVRMTTPFVKVYDTPPLFKGHRCVLLSGQDRSGINAFQTEAPGK